VLRQVSQGIHLADRNDPSGWRVSMTLVELGGGRLLVHSPSWLGEATTELVERCGEPALLFAPNHFHHVSLPKFRSRWPQARAVAAKDALPRLAAKGHADLVSLDALKAEDLGPVRFHPAPGTRNGETWLSVGDTLVVCDSFFNLPGPLSGAMGLVLRATRTGPGLKLGRTFRWLALADVRSYRAWVEDTLDALAPKRVLFSHGDPLEGNDAADRLRQAMRAALD